MPLEIYTDGGSRGNPGPAASAVVIRDETGQSLLEAGYFLGKATNNVAEYKGLVLALEAAAKSGHDSIAIHMDSELIVKQLTGEYRVKDPTLAELFGQAQRLLLKFDNWRVKHVRRELNKRADALVNKALDAGMDVVAVQKGNIAPDARPIPKPEHPAGSRPVVGAAPQSVASRPPSTTPALAPAGEDDANLIFPVTVRCITDPRQDACKAGMQQDLEFFFTDAAPGGLCVHAMKAVLDTVLTVQYAASKGEKLPPARVRCRRPSCGAEFEVRLASNQ